MDILFDVCCIAYYLDPDMQIQKSIFKCSIPLIQCVCIFVIVHTKKTLMSIWVGTMEIFFWPTSKTMFSFPRWVSSIYIDPRCDPL